MRIYAAHGAPPAPAPARAQWRSPAAVQLRAEVPTARVGLFKLRRSAEVQHLRQSHAYKQAPRHASTRRERRGRVRRAGAPERARTTCPNFRTARRPSGWIRGSDAIHLSQRVRFRAPTARRSPTRRAFLSLSVNGAVLVGLGRRNGTLSVNGAVLVGLGRRNGTLGHEPRVPFLKTKQHHPV